MKKLLVLFVILALLPAAMAAFKVTIGDASNYCDCDEKCIAEDPELRCVSFESPAMFLDSDSVQEKITVSNSKGYNGVCAFPMMDGGKVNFQLTSSCAKQSEHINAAQEPVVDDSTEDNSTTDDSTSDTDDTTDDADDTSSNQITGNVVNDTTDDNASDDAAQGVLDQIKQDEPAEDKPKEESSMTTSWMAAITIIVIALFVLIGWIAYLHYTRK